MKDCSYWKFAFGFAFWDKRVCSRQHRICLVLRPIGGAFQGCLEKKVQVFHQ
jgi:hypothetical protein